MVPSDFGVVGDGKADDTVGLNAFFAALSTVGGSGLMPAEYLITGPINHFVSAPFDLVCTGRVLVGGSGTYIGIRLVAGGETASVCPITADAAIGSSTVQVQTPDLFAVGGYVAISAPIGFLNEARQHLARVVAKNGLVLTIYPRLPWPVAVALSPMAKLVNLGAGSRIRGLRMDGAINKANGGGASGLLVDGMLGAEFAEIETRDFAGTGQQYFKAMFGCNFRRLRDEKSGGPINVAGTSHHLNGIASRDAVAKGVVGSVLTCSTIRDVDVRRPQGRALQLIGCAELLVNDVRLIDPVLVSATGYSFSTGSCGIISSNVFVTGCGSAGVWLNGTDNHRISIDALIAKNNGTDLVASATAPLHDHDLAFTRVNTDATISMAGATNWRIERDFAEAQSG